MTTHINNGTLAGWDISLSPSYKELCTSLSNKRPTRIRDNGVRKKVERKREIATRHAHEKKMAILKTRRSR
jgi:hypothetical protein